MMGTLVFHKATGDGLWMPVTFLNWCWFVMWRWQHGKCSTSRLHSCYTHSYCIKHTLFVVAKWLPFISDSAFVFTVDQGLKVWLINMVWIVAGTTESIFLRLCLFNSRRVFWWHRRVFASNIYSNIFHCSILDVLYIFDIWKIFWLRSGLFIVQSLFDLY